LAQLFDPRIGFYLRLFALAVIAATVAAIAAWRAGTDYHHGLRQSADQPVPFSHRHHVGDDGIDCRYCHASVETSAFAGIPAVSTCMSCHSQLFTSQAALRPLLESMRSAVPLHWERLNNLPDFVYFNHSIHVAKGVGCASCHGLIDTMPLTARTAPLEMQWCLACHRNPEHYLRPKDQVFNLRWRSADQAALGTQLLHDYRIDKRRLADCSVCHR
jgi:formamidopyrimidine-DNA glycosylase